MARFNGTKRNEYTKDKVREMRSERKLVKAKKDGVSDSDLQYYLGDLLAAGHIQISNIVSYKQSEEVVGDKMLQSTRNVEFVNYTQEGFGERPQLTGYLMSGSDRDKRYKLKGWFNEDGTIRLELVK